jgi:phosphate starvation-inducible PhoH-like protein
MTKKKNENGNGAVHTQEKESILRTLKARSQNQKEYLHAIDNNIIIFCTGPSGTGKTLLACYVAARDLLEKRIEKIILTRPIVEAGESLGYLPGDVAEKVDPYIRPLLDCLEKVIPKQMIKSFIAEGKIEICPFAFMRGRNLENCFIIADECQNAVYSQLKLLLTRLGENSKIVVTADMDQIDLIDEESGMIKIPGKLLNRVHGVEGVNLTPDDVQRSPIVQQLVKYL